MSLIATSSRVPDASGLGQDLRISGMARALEKVLQLTNPHQRQVELRRAGFIRPDPQEEREAIKRVLLKGRALAAPVGSFAA